MYEDYSKIAIRLYRSNRNGAADPKCSKIIISRTMATDNKHPTSRKRNSTSSSSWPVLMYIPNLMGYARTVLALVALVISSPSDTHNAKE